MRSYRPSSRDAESSITEKENNKTGNLVCLPFISFESVDSNVSSVKVLIQTFRRWNCEIISSLNLVPFASFSLHVMMKIVIKVTMWLTR